MTAKYAGSWTELQQPQHLQSRTVHGGLCFTFRPWQRNLKFQLHYNIDRETQETLFLRKVYFVTHSVSQNQFIVPRHSALIQQNTGWPPVEKINAVKFLVRHQECDFLCYSEI